MDPVTVSVIQGALENIATEMGHKLMRMSYSSIIRESEDFGAGLVDADGQGLAESAQSTPLQSGPIPGYVQGMLRQLAERGDAIRPGDVIMHNDAYAGASHGPDVAFIVPAFHRERLVGFAVTTAHHLDIGALTPGSCGIVDAIDAYAEGLQFKSIKVYEAGRKIEPVWQLLRDNIRASDLVVGDMEAQIAASRIGAERFVALHERYGLETVEAAGEAAKDHAERLMRSAIAGLPDGTWTATTFIDGYLDSEDPTKRNLPLVATITVEGDEMTVDLTGTADQVPDRPINMPLVGTVDIAVWLTVRSVLLDTAVHGHIPVNSGLVRPIRIVAPRGSLVNPVFPAPTIARFCPGNQLADTVMKALAEAVPEQVSAGIGNLNVIAFSGLRGETHWVHMEIFEGSYGGRHGMDGMDAVDTLYANTRNNPIEDIESHLPLRVRRYELREDVCGAGRWRGGLGSVREFEYLDDGGGSVEGEGHGYRPWGFRGGGDGRPASLVLARADGSSAGLPSKVPHTVVAAGDAFVCEGPAGGGYGDPLERDAAQVLDDVLDGLISAETAERDYAVVITGGDTLDRGGDGGRPRRPPRLTSRPAAAPAAYEGGRVRGRGRRRAIGRSITSRRRKSSRSESGWRIRPRSRCKRVAPRVPARPGSRGEEERAAPGRSATRPGIGASRDGGEGGGRRTPPPVCRSRTPNGSNLSARAARVTGLGGAGGGTASGRRHGDSSRPASGADAAGAAGGSPLPGRRHGDSSSMATSSKVASSAPASSPYPYAPRSKPASGWSSVWSCSILSRSRAMNEPAISTPQLAVPGCGPRRSSVPVPASARVGDRGRRAPFVLAALAPGDAPPHPRVGLDVLHPVVVHDPEVAAPERVRDRLRHLRLGEHHLGLVLLDEGDHLLLPGHGQRALALGLRLGDLLLGLGLVDLEPRPDVVADVDVRDVDREDLERGPRIEAALEHHLRDLVRVLEHPHVVLGRPDGGHDALADPGHDRLFGRAADQPFEVRPHRDPGLHLELDPVPRDRVDGAARHRARRHVDHLRVDGGVDGLLGVPPGEVDRAAPVVGQLDVRLVGGDDRLHHPHDVSAREVVRLELVAGHLDSRLPGGDARGDDGAGIHLAEPHEDDLDEAHRSVGEDGLPPEPERVPDEGEDDEDDDRPDREADKLNDHAGLFSWVHGKSPCADCARVGAAIRTAAASRR